MKDKSMLESMYNVIQYPPNKVDRHFLDCHPQHYFIWSCVSNPPEDVYKSHKEND